MWGGEPRPGDWVVSKELVRTSLTDRLTGGGLRPGTRGVVVARSGSRLVVEFDTGYGRASARVPAGVVRVVRRGGGRDRFERRTGLMTTIRLAVAAFLMFPVLWWIGAYLWTYRTLDGIVPAFAVAALDSLGELVATAIAHPGRSLVYALFLAALGRFAFR